MLQGGSALLVSKNHRALDEVEERLTPLIGDAPLLTRARDGDGGRDTDFLDALATLAGGEARSGGEATVIAGPVVARARQMLDARQRAGRIEALHVVLSAEWNDETSGTPPFPPASHRSDGAAGGRGCARGSGGTTPVGPTRRKVAPTSTIASRRCGASLAC